MTVVMTILLARFSGGQGCLFVYDRWVQFRPARTKWREAVVAEVAGIRSWERSVTTFACACVAAAIP